MVRKRAVLELISARTHAGKLAWYRTLVREFFELSEEAACDHLKRLWSQRLIEPGSVREPQDVYRLELHESMRERRFEMRLAVVNTVSTLLTVQEVARFLRVNERTVRRWVSRDGLPCIHLGTRLRFSPRNVLRWVSAREEAGKCRND